ncbi:MAG: alkaline phosphatase family protein [Gemmatimonadota bacterium]
MPVEHVVLVSMDAFRPEFCQDETWPAPTLQQLAWEGAYATSVHSVFPALTYPAHTTIVTGALPARLSHGRSPSVRGSTGIFPTFGLPMQPPMRSPDSRRRHTQWIARGSRA